MFGFGILQTFGAIALSVVVSFTAGYFNGGADANAAHKAVKAQIEANLKIRNETHLEYVKTLEEQLAEAIDHANILPAKPCLDAAGVRVLNSIR